MDMSKYFTENEIQIIEDYIEDPGYGNAGVVPELMGHWADAKEQYLMRLFGGQLIHEKKISCQLPENEIKYEYRELRAKYRFFLDKLTDALTEQGFVLTYKSQRHSWTSSNDVMYDYFYDTYIYWVLEETALMSNATLEEYWIFPLNEFRNDHVHGCNPTKVIAKFPKGGKIARFFKFILNVLTLKDTEKAYFEEQVANFCTDLSRQRQTDSFKGTLCISIHPMDYFTMSDNGYNWHSCMSWHNDGEYKAGTLEMCNSNSVIVAYLKGTAPFGNWNSKRWRELFVVTEDMILGVKGYPFASTALEDEVMTMIRELAEKNCGWTYRNAEPVRCGPGRVIVDDIEFKWSISFNKMYNDCYSSHHPVLVGTWVENEDYIELLPSGTAYCIYSGKIIPNDCPESLLVHPDHSNLTKCPRCGYWYDPDCDGGYADKWGEYVCESCLDAYYEEQDNCDEED